MNNTVSLCEAASILAVKRSKLWRQISKGYVKYRVDNGQYRFQVGYLHQIKSRGYFDLEYEHIG